MHTRSWTGSSSLPRADHLRLHREAVTQEQFDKGILVPLAWPQPEHYDYRNEEFPTFSSMEFRSSRKDQQAL